MIDPVPPLPPEDHYVDSNSVESQKSQAEGRVFPCPRCGADVVFHIGSQKLQCPYCGYQQDLKVDTDSELAERDYHAELERILEFREEETLEIKGLKEVHCDSCNGDVIFEGTLTSRHCPYCASPIQLDKIHELETRIKPDGVLPFQIDHRKARQSLRSWVSSLWFAPNDFLKQGVSGDFSGVYLPYWTYDSMTSTAYKGERGETYSVKVGSGNNQRNETRVRWYPASGNFQRFFDDVLVSAAEGLNPQLVRGMEPWPLKKMLPFTREALAGYLARTYDLPLEQGFAQAKSRMDAALNADAQRHIGGDRQRLHQIKIVHSAITFKLIILPIWLLSYRYQGKVYQVMLNAATGKVSGQRPWSVWKILIGCGIAALAMLIAWGALIAFAN